jgi:hypothetical protein
MADLNTQTTDGRLSFTKYVTENKRYAEIEFEIEAKKQTPMFVSSGSSLKQIGTKEYKAGTKLHIVNPKFKLLGKIKYAECKIGSTKGLIPISQIRKPTVGNGTQYEDEVVDIINKTILAHGRAIDIRLKGDTKTYKNILYAIKVDSKIKNSAGVKGDPKADIILCCDIKKPLDKTSIFISHKKEGGPEAFQQYGGLSAASGKVINDHPTVQKFLGIVADNIENDVLQHPVMANFKDKNLACASIYGPDYGKAFSINHTQLIGQGKPVLKTINGGKIFELDFSSHMSLSGDLSHFIGGYLPVLAASFRSGRSFEYKNKRYLGARVGIYPWKLIAGRSGTVVYNL